MEGRGRAGPPGTCRRECIQALVPSRGKARLEGEVWVAGGEGSGAGL